jgi:hypothetical protein
MLYRVVSVCKSDAISVWAVSHKHILQFIDAKDYVVYVPDDEVAAFQAVSDPRFRVVGETSLIGNLMTRLQVCMPDGAMQRAGWYLQQMIKIAALADVPDDEVALIWDAVTVPLKRLEFVDGAGRVLHYRGAERHKPYFRTLKRILGLRRQSRYSFVTQCIAVKGAWVRGMKDLAERKHGAVWDEVFLSQTDFTQPSGFSEYEMLGSYAKKRHRREFRATNRKWCRSGNSMFGGIENLDATAARSAAVSYDFVAFEKWDVLI